MYEVVDNSIDEAMAGYCTGIETVIHDDDSITGRNKMAVDEDSDSQSSSSSSSSSDDDDDDSIEDGEGAMDNYDSPPAPAARDPDDSRIVVRCGSPKYNSYPGNTEYAEATKDFRADFVKAGRDSQEREDILQYFFSHFVFLRGDSNQELSIPEIRMRLYKTLSDPRKPVRTGKSSSNGISKMGRRVISNEKAKSLPIVRCGEKLSRLI